MEPAQTLGLRPRPSRWARGTSAQSSSSRSARSASAASGPACSSASSSAASSGESQGGGLYQSDDRSGHLIVYFDTDDIDDSIEKVRDNGGEAEDKQPIPGVGWFAGAKDSEGNAFSLFQSDESAAPPS